MSQRLTRQKWGTQQVAAIVMAAILMVQAVQGVLLAPLAAAATSAITSMAFTTPARTVKAGAVSQVMTVQPQNAASTQESYDTPGNVITISSDSASGEFSTNGTTGWAPANVTTRGSGANTNVYYRDTAAGIKTITATVALSDGREFSTTQQLTVTALTLAERIAGAASGATIDITADETVTGNLVISKPLTLTSSNGATIFTNGTGNLFRITSPDVTISNLRFEKADNLNQNIISIGAPATIINNTFTGQYSLAVNAGVTRALEISAVTGVTITGNTIKHLRQPAYINDGASGAITNNYVDDTRGWVVEKASSFSFTGNTWGVNAVDIAIIPGVGNGLSSIYTCELLDAVRAANNYPVIDNQVADCPDVTTPSVPTGGQPHAATVTTNEFDFTWSASTDNRGGAVAYEYRASQDIAQVGDAPDDSGAWRSGVLTSPTIHSSGAADGAWYWQVRAIDQAGNKSAWSQVWQVVIDTVPAPPVVTLTMNSQLNGRVVSGTVTHSNPTFVLTINGVQRNDIAIEVDASDTQGVAIWRFTLPADVPPGQAEVTLRASAEGASETLTRRYVVQFGGAGITPVVVPEDDAELARLSASLTQPFVIPAAASFGVVPSPAAPIRSSDVLGVETADVEEISAAATTPAVAATQDGWKIFGIAWQWWLLLAALLGLAIYRLVAAARRRAAKA